jgi:hypothetical protein
MGRKDDESAEGEWEEVGRGGSNPSQYAWPVALIWELWIRTTWETRTPSSRQNLTPDASPSHLSNDVSGVPLAADSACRVYVPPMIIYHTMKFLLLSFRYI